MGRAITTLATPVINPRCENIIECDAVNVSCPSRAGRLYQSRSSTRPATSASSLTVIGPWLITSPPYAAPPTFICDNYAWSQSHCLLMQQWRSCRVLLLVILTTVTLCSVASQTVCSGASSRPRTRQRDSPPSTRRRDHITPVLRQLHWLSVRQRVDFKLALLAYKALHDATARFGNRSFAAARPRLWNSLPARIRQPDNDIGEFRRQLKSFLFKWHRGAYCDFLILCAFKYSDSLTHSLYNFLRAWCAPAPSSTIDLVCMLKNFENRLV